MIHRGPGFSRQRMIWLLPHLSPFWRHIERLTQRDDLLTGDVGVGGRETNHSAAINPGPLLIIQYSRTFGGGGGVPPSLLPVSGDRQLCVGAPGERMRALSARDSVFIL